MNKKNIPVFKSIAYRFPNIYFTFNSFKILEFKELLKGIELSDKDIILDLGCGDGLLTLLLGKKCKKIIGIDISLKALTTAYSRAQFSKKKINSEFKCVKIENAGFDDNFFNKIFSVCVMEHIANYHEVLKETYRILKEGGQIIMSVDSIEITNNYKISDFHKKKFSVKKYFKVNELRDLLKSIGFKNIKIFPILKSEYAKNLFIKKIYDFKKLNFFTFLFEYLILKYYENRSNKINKGLILVAKCDKYQ